MPYSLIRGRRLATRCLILATGLISATCLHAQTASPVQAPTFYDEPKFTVSDVADPTSLGGHGSNATAGAKESLARDVVSLDNSSRPAPPAIVEDETALRTALQHDPANAELNYRLGKALLAAANARAAVPYLDRASRARPHDYQISLDLARAYSAAGDHAQARASILRLMAVRDNAELHRLLAGVEEESGDSLAAVHEFQRAAELEPSEPNLFD